MMKELNYLLKYVASSEASKEMVLKYEARIQKGVVDDASVSPFSQRLAQMALRNHLWLGLIDVWTRLFDRANLIRFKLNTVVALYECSPEFSQFLEKSERGTFRNRLQIVGIGLKYLGTLIISIGAVGGLYLAHLVAAPQAHRINE
jgi:hypothetical protein